jgi:hypothetical protein
MFAGSIKSAAQLVVIECLEGVAAASVGAHGAPSNAPAMTAALVVAPISFTRPALGDHPKAINSVSANAAR